MNRRLPNSRPTPSLTRGAETPETPCAGRWDVYDALVDHKGGPVLRRARRDAIELCAACPIKATCHAENAGEEWLHVLAALPTRPCAQCGDEMSVVKKGPRRQYCSAGCGIAARKARRAVA